MAVEIRIVQNDDGKVTVSGSSGDPLQIGVIITAALHALLMRMGDQTPPSRIIMP